MKKTIVFAIIAFIAIVIILLGVRIITHKKAGAGTGGEESFDTPVVVSKVRLTDIYTVREYTGEIEPENVVNVFPKVSGKIIKNYVSEGDLVATGKWLSEIDRELTGFEYKNYPLISPVKGFVFKVHADPGNNVYPQSPVFTIYQMDAVKIIFYIPENDFIPDIMEKRIGLSVPSAEYHNQDLSLTSVSPVLDPMTRSFKSEITMKNPDYELKPGSFAKVSVYYEASKHTLAVPRDSLISSEEGDYVFVVDDNMVKEVEVRTGLDQGKLVEITEGLSEGQLVILKGIYSVKNGDKVFISETEDVEK